MLPQAIRELSALGLEDQLEAHGVEAREFTYLNRHGQQIFSETCGRFAGYGQPHFSIHRVDLHKVLHQSVVKRLGPTAVYLGYRSIGFDQDENEVVVRFDGAEPVKGNVATGCDGFHSAIRGQFYPDEGVPQFERINMWRGCYP